jgi:hypothetical protein
MVVKLLIFSITHNYPFIPIITLRPDPPGILALQTAAPEAISTAKKPIFIVSFWIAGI